MSESLLFSPLTIRGLTMRNRVVISPMCQYSADDGVANDWHFAHLAKLGLGGAGLAFVEATAVEPNGRITHGDLGLWSDAHIAPLKRIAEFLKRHGCLPGIQLAHAGRKASIQRPWHGNGPMDASDRARGEVAWKVVAPSALPVDSGWLVPYEMTIADIERLKEQWRAATRRACEAGFEVVEVHGAHGYLIHEFLSPLSNRRDDRYGGDFEGRSRMALEVAEIVRNNWPKDRPVFFRLSCADEALGGWSIDETIDLAHRLKVIGVDVIDCSSGGIAGPATAVRSKRTLGFQIPYADRIRREAKILSMAVGLIIQPAQAEEALRAGRADLIAIGRQALFNPNWALHARIQLGLEQSFESWPPQYGWWLDKRQRSLSEENASAAVHTVPGLRIKAD